MSDAVDTRTPWSDCFHDAYEATKQRTRTMKNIHFRVKRITLAAEARIIKQQEARALRIARSLAKSNLKPTVAERNYALYQSLRIHRIHVLRPHARAAHLAHAYLKGMAYTRVEDPEKLHAPVPESVVTEIASTVRRFGTPGVTEKHVRSWMDGGPTVAQMSEIARQRENAPDEPAVDSAANTAA